MKKLKYLIILLIGIIAIPVNAASYELKELIPLDIENTIVTKNFSYRDFYYSNKDSNKYIVFKSIKNISDKERPVTISVALFDKNKKNIGIINYCSTKDDYSIMANTVLKAKEEKSFSLEITKDHLGKGETVKDIKYISILNENINCNTEGSRDYIGYTVEEIGIPKNTGLDTQSELLITILSIVGLGLILLFLYKFVFTNAYQNMDGDDVRIGYKKYNKQLKKEREEELKRNPPKEPEPVKVKTDEVIRQEEEAAKEDKSGTDLHNLYK